MSENYVNKAAPIQSRTQFVSFQRVGFNKDGIFFTSERRCLVFHIGKYLTEENHKKLRQLKV